MGLDSGHLVCLSVILLVGFCLSEQDNGTACSGLFRPQFFTVNMVFVFRSVDGFVVGICHLYCYIAF